MTTPEERPSYSPLPVLNADNGGIWLRDTTGFSVFNTQAAITDKAEHPEIIARWFDNAFSLENGIGCNMGPVGVVVKDFEVVEEGKLYDEKKAIQKFYEPNLTEGVIPKVKIAEEDMETYSDYSTLITNYFTGQQAQFIAGELDASDDATWQAYVDGFKAQNLEEYCRILGVEEIIE